MPENESVADGGDFDVETFLEHVEESPEEVVGWAQEVRRRERELGLEEKRLEARQEKLEEFEERLDERAEALTERANQLEEKRLDLQDKRGELEAEFQKGNREALEQFEGEVDTLESKLEDLRDTIAEKRAEWADEKDQLHEELEAELDRRRQQCEERCQERLDEVDIEIEEKWDEFRADKKEWREELEERETELEEREKKLRRREKRVERRADKLEAEAQAAKEEKQAEVAGEIERLEREVERLENRLEEVCRERDTREERIEELEEQKRAFGHRSADDVLDELEKLREEREKLKRKLASRPAEDLRERLQAVEEERDTLRDERNELLEEREQLRKQLDRADIAATELETQRDKVEALQARVEILTENRKEIKNEVDELIEERESAEVFPTCAKMDRRDAYQEKPGRLHQELSDLQDFAGSLRHRIATLGPDLDPSTDEQLYYTERDVRSFLGGLAMSQMTLLQGISGTGKTSLPLAFAEAIGGGAEVVAVQAGWRDKHDLLGHYNAFEKRYYESDFLQALYKAQTPKWQYRPFIILLDEMNLSHPEQYFADFLHALEVDESKRTVTLLSGAVGDPPNLLEEKDGRLEIRVPDNVWFVGTANHDETTVDFADKTYDRSHVMELPRHHETFEPKGHSSGRPLSTATLSHAFEEAREDHAEEARLVRDAFRSIAEVLGERFDVGWGNRLERQIEDYVPVVVDAGGSCGEAADRLLATKVLRKVQDRYDTRPEDFEKLEEMIEDEWTVLDGAEPEESMQVIDREKRRLEGGV